MTAQRPGLSSEPDPSPNRRKKRLKRRAFPLHLLPDEVQELVRAISRSRCVDESVPASLALAALGSAIGLSRVYYDSYADWEEVSMIWAAIISTSGSRKTTLIEDLFFGHQIRQQFLFKAYQADLKKFNQEFTEWQRDSKKKSTEIVPPPTEPKLEHVFTTNSTPEALVSMLGSSPRGVLILNDELVTLLGGMGRYSGKADGDRGFYLSLFRGTSFKNDRKGDGTIMLSKAAASIAGGIQPGILRLFFDGNAFRSGLVPRFLLVFAPPQVKQYRKGPGQKEKAAYARLIEGLFRLQMDTILQEDGEFAHRPLRVEVCQDARDLLETFIPWWSSEAMGENEKVESAMSKLEGYALRFALILRVCREVTHKVSEDEPISRADLEAGIELAQWFRDEALFVYQELASAEDATPRTKLLARAEVIRSQCGGAVTAREWHKRNTRRTTEEAKTELDELVAGELAVWRDRPAGPEGGRPTSECAVIEPEPPEGDPEGFGVQPEGPDGVSGFGLRGAWAPRDARDEGSTPPDDPKRGVPGEDLPDPPGDCTPKPPPEQGDDACREDGCTPHPATRNLFDDLGPQQGGSSWMH